MAFTQTGIVHVVKDHPFDDDDPPMINRDEFSLYPDGAVYLPDLRDCCYINARTIRKWLTTD